jgi:hypothetical protein
MAPDSNSPVPSIPKSRNRFVRLLFPAFTAIVGFGGIGLLILYSNAVYRVDCTGSLGYMLPMPALGVAAMVACGKMLMFLGTDSNKSWRFYLAAAVSIFVIPALFFLVINPIATKQRAIRHMEEMKERMPILNEIVALVDASKDQLGHIPTDETEFYKVVFSDQFNDEELPCCWGVSYNKIDSERYVIQYSSADVLYAYDSSTPECGWHPAESELEH